MTNQILHLSFWNIAFWQKNQPEKTKIWWKSWIEFMIYEKNLNTKHFQEDKNFALYRSGDVLVFNIWSMFISYGITKVEILSCLSFSHDSSK